MKTVDTLVVGAGISGLTYALFASDDCLIVEKDASPGGLCRTFYEGEYVWDYAGHFFHFADNEIKRFFEEFTKPEDIVSCVKQTNINYNGRIIDYPFQMNIHQLPKDEFIDCLYYLFQRDASKYDTFLEMLYAKFGRGITDRFLKPYNEKLYACNLNDLDKDAMGRFFPYADPREIILNMKRKEKTSYNDSFDYPKLGAQYYIDKLVKKVGLNRIQLNAPFTSIDIEKNVASVNGTPIKYKKLVSTIPLNVFSSYLPLEERRIVDGILKSNKVLVFNLGFDRGGDDTLTHWTYYPMKETNFYRVGFYNNILKTEKLSMYVEIGYKSDSLIDIDEELTTTIKNLREIGVITDHKLVDYNAIVIDPAYVHISTDSVSAVTDLKRRLAEKSIYTIGRYGGWKYCSMEDCMIEASNLALELNSQ